MTTGPVAPPASSSGGSARPAASGKVPDGARGPGGGVPHGGPAGPGGAPGALRRRRLLRSAAGLFAVAFILTTAKLFVFPKRDVPAPVDAIVMFAGSPGRLELAVSLARFGYAPVLAVSQPTPDNICPPDTIPAVEVICFHPQPLTTQGESRWTAAAAAARGWRSIIVITSTTQDSRARLRLGRCYDGQIKIIPIDPPNRATWAYMITYEWAAMAKALVLQRGC